METPPPSLPPSADPSNDKLLIIFCHLSIILGVGIVLPLVIFLIKKDESPLVAQHAKEALNFHITVVIAMIVSFILVFLIVGVFLMIAVGIGALVLSILATIKASEGGFYRYPMTLRLVS